MMWRLVTIFVQCSYFFSHLGSAFCMIIIIRDFSTLIIFSKWVGEGRGREREEINQKCPKCHKCTCRRLQSMLFMCISMSVAGRYANMDVGCFMHNVLCMCTNTQVWREDSSPMQCSLQADFGWSHWLATSKLLHSSHSHIKGKSIYWRLVGPTCLMYMYMYIHVC